MSRIALGLFVLALVTPAFAEAPAQPEPPLESGANPEWCKQGWICRPAAWAFDLDARIQVLKKKQKRLHIDATCGPTAVFRVQEGNVDMESGFLGCTAGVSFRIW